MFYNIGKTIKIMAKVFWWIGTITIVGILFIWPSAFILYGFGELIEKQTATVNLLKSQKQTTNYTEPTKNCLPEI